MTASYTLIINVTDHSTQQQIEHRVVFNAPALPILLPGSNSSEVNFMDNVEQTIIEIGNQMQRALFAHHLRLIEAQLCENPTHRNPECQVVRDGHAALKVATRFGVVNVQRQVLECRTCGEHFIPMNALLPEHNGMVITKGLQEMACLFSLSSSYEGATRLVGEFCHDPDVLCAREIELLVNQHGANVRQQEAERAKAMENTPDVNPETVSQHLKDLSPSRRKVWPEEVQEAVNRALERPEIEEIPFGLPKRDWDRIVEHVRGNWNSTEELDPLLLANLGPKPQEGEAVIFADGIVICVLQYKSRPGCHVILGHFLSRNSGPPPLPGEGVE